MRELSSISETEGEIVSQPCQYIHKHRENSYLHLNCKFLRLSIVSVLTLLYGYSLFQPALVHNVHRRQVRLQVVLLRSRNLQYNFRLLFAAEISRDMCAKSHTTTSVPMASYFFAVLLQEGYLLCYRLSYLSLRHASRATSLVRGRRGFYSAFGRRMVTSVPSP